MLDVVMGSTARLLLVFATLTLGPWAQGRPDFSGTWSVIPSRSIWYDKGHPINITVVGERFTAEQTEHTLTVAIDNEEGFKRIYRLDGTATKKTPPGPDGPQEAASTARWSDSALVITTVGRVNRDGGWQRAETRRRLTLNADGTLRVEAPWGLDGAMIGSEYSRVQ